MTMFKDLMNGLEEVESFLAAEKAECQVNVPDGTDAKGAHNQPKLTQASRQVHYPTRTEEP